MTEETLHPIWVNVFDLVYGIITLITLFTGFFIGFIIYLECCGRISESTFLSKFIVSDPVPHIPETTNKTIRKRLHRLRTKRRNQN